MHEWKRKLRECNSPIIPLNSLNLSEAIISPEVKRADELTQIIDLSKGQELLTVSKI